MSALGHSLPMRLVSASHDVRSTPKADIRFHRNTSSDGPETDSCAAANSISIRFYSITSSARAMSFTNGSTLICVNDVARKHKRDVLATPQHVEIKRRVKCLKCEYAFWQQSLRLALDLAEPCLPRQCR